MLCGPVKLRDATVEEVLDATDGVADRGRLKAHKRAWIQARPGPWVLASVPITMLNYQELEDSSWERIARAVQYGNQPEASMPPGLADYGKTPRSRATGKAYVMDGNHRVLAAYLTKRAAVRMWMPLDGFLALQQAAVTDAPATVQATVTFSIDADGRAVAEVTSDDELARDTTMLALREFWSTDADDYKGANQAKWRRRLRP